jgi:hypothetical protein
MKVESLIVLVIVGIVGGVITLGWRAGAANHAKFKAAEARHREFLATVPFTVQVNYGGWTWDTYYALSEPTVTDEGLIIETPRGRVIVQGHEAFVCSPTRIPVPD